MVVENSPESHKPVEIGVLRFLTIPECDGHNLDQPGAERPLRGRRGPGRGRPAGLADLD